MNMKTTTVLASAALTFAVSLAAAAPASTRESERDMRQELDALQKRLEALEREKADGKESSEKPSWSDKVKIHGYGEMHYNAHKGSDAIKDAKTLPAALDFHRFVWGVRYDFTDRITLDSEIDFEHATEEIEFEFAYLDFRWRDALNFRVGKVLMPVGSLNEFHEPPLFHSVERPYFHTLIVPTTWGEGGAGVHGSAGDFSYRAYVVTGLSAVKYQGSQSQFIPSSGIRKGRQGLQNTERSWASNVAAVGRLEWRGVKGLRLGASLYTGDSAQSAASFGKDVGRARVTLMEADARYEVAGAQFHVEYANIRVGNADKISAVLGQTMGSRIAGGYAEAAYNILHSFKKKHELFAFARFESLDTHAAVPSGRARDKTFARQIRTFGLSYRPVHNVAVKADVERWKDGAGKRLTRLNLGVAYDF